MAGERARRFCQRCGHHHYGGEHTVISKTCLCCEKSFSPSDWRVVNCSRRCSKLRDLPTKICERCGNEFRKNTEYSYAVWGRIRFCSIACRGNGRPGTILTCATCGTDFQKRQYHYPSKRHYCSQACYWFSLRTERYPVNRKHRRLNNLEFSHRQKRALLERADRKCQRCGAAKNLECDHVVPIWNEGRNTATNGQVLCRPCHREKTQLDVSAYWATCATHVAECSSS